MPELIRLSDPGVSSRLALLESMVCAYPWSAIIYQQAIASERECVQVLSIDDEWQAVLVSEIILDELHIHNIFVPLTAQRQGFARMLLTTILAQAQANGVVRCLLEVRVGNVAAIALYHALGFVRGGLRKGYYRDENGREDALLMECVL